MAAASVPYSSIGPVTPAEAGLRQSQASQITELPYFAADELTKVL